MDRVGLHVIAIPPQAVPEDDGVHSVVVEIRNKIGAFRANIEGIVSASGREDDSSTRVDAAFHRMHFYGWVVDVNNAVDPAGHGLAEVVLLGFAKSIVIEMGRIGWVQRNDHAALQD